MPVKIEFFEENVRLAQQEMHALLMGISTVKATTLAPAHAEDKPKRTTRKATAKPKDDPKEDKVEETEAVEPEKEVEDAEVEEVDLEILTAESRKLMLDYGAAIRKAYAAENDVDLKSKEAQDAAMTATREVFNDLGFGIGLKQIGENNPDKMAKVKSRFENELLKLKG